MRYVTAAELLDLEKTEAAELLEKTAYPWQILPLIEEYIRYLGPKLPAELYEQREEGVWVARDAKVAPSAYLGKLCIIGSGTEVRHCAFIRGRAIIGRGCVVGNSTEVKNAVLFDEVEVPHFNYVGDSVLGYKAHMGAGAVTSNVKADKGLIRVTDGKESLDTQLASFGAILGDYAEVGCNSVLNPGTILGRHTVIYPVSCVRGVIPEGYILKEGGNLVSRRLTN